MPYNVIDKQRCKGCGLCTVACPKKLVAMSTDTLGNSIAVSSEAGSCTGCGLCAEMCPDVAISVFKNE